MGYYTNFQLDMVDAKIHEPIYSDSMIYLAVQEAFGKINDYVDFDGLIDGSAESYKWYNWRTQMLQLAREFPSIHFTLSGEGEDREDNWIADFIDNRFAFRRAEIVYPELKDAEWVEVEVE